MSTRKPSPPPPMRKPATLDHLRKKRQLSRFVSFCPEDLPEPNGLRMDSTDKERKEHEVAIKEWREAVEEATVEFVISSLSRLKYQELIEAHPPTEEQIEEAKKNNEVKPDNNPDTFGPALIAACISQPEGVTQEDADAIWNEWPPGEALDLYLQCVQLNRSSRLEFYQKKSGTTRG